MKRSIVYEKSDQEFISLFYRSHSQKEFSRFLGISYCGGGTYFSLTSRCDELHLPRKSQWAKAQKIGGLARSMSKEEYFAKGTSRTGKSTRARILRDHLLPYRCAVCGNPGEWNGKPVSLEVDHINGDHFDNRLENLRFLCPNCHSQTATFSGRNRGKNVKEHSLNLTEQKNCYLPALKAETPTCLSCGKPLTRWCKHGLCHDCAIVAARKVKRPDPQKLLSEARKLGVAGVARKYGVVDSVYRKWLSEAGLPNHRAEIRAYPAKEEKTIEEN